MSTDEIREKYLSFFEKKGHKKIEPSPLILKDDPTTLFTSSGMQQLVPYFLGKPHPKGKRLTDSQPSFRAVDIDEVGDNRHTTFFEMLGNWSLDDYFKKEQLNYIWEFLTKELGLPKEKLCVTVFKGSHGVLKDEESIKIWKRIGIPEEKIFSYGAKENWWSRTGTPDEMTAGEIGGPDSEVFYEFTDVKHDPKYGEKCHPNCQCGRFLEIANSVFIQYRKNEKGELEELPQKNVDFGGGLERMAAAVKNTQDVFNTDLFLKIIDSAVEVSGRLYEGEKKVPFQVIADHIKAATFIVGAGVTPLNKERGYILRRLIRRSAVKMRSLKGKVEGNDFDKLIDSVFEIYQATYLKEGKERVKEVVKKEVEKFKGTLEKGLKKVEKIEKIDGKKAFDLYQTYGFPLEITMELFAEKGQKVDKKDFYKEFEKHKKLSRVSSKGKFKGGLADKSENTVKLHTATHLLHEALRRILGEGVEQKGSNITKKRLRFDLSYKKKMTNEQTKKVEDIVNEQVKKGLPVSFKKMKLDEALKEGYLAFFGGKYANTVKVYTIGDPEGEWFSKEVCGGPHVLNTKEIGRVRIVKQKKIGTNLLRIYATNSPK